VKRKGGVRKAMATQQQSSAGILLAKQLKLMQTTDHIEGISVGLVNDKSLFEWEVMLMISDECRLYGGECERLGSGGEIEKNGYALCV
jgi:hypothetical protein